MRKQHGFTLIEVALVFAIAALIFLMAFIALPSLQTSQRDAARKAKVMEFISDVKTYQTNNSRGALPVLLAENGDGPEVFTFIEAKDSSDKDNTWKGMVRDYVGADFADPSAGDYQYRFFVVMCRGGEMSPTLSTGQACSYGQQNSVPDGDGGSINLDFIKINNPDNINLTTGVDHTIYVVVGATCDGDHAVKTSGNRSVAAIQTMERGGRYCYNT